VFDADQVPEMRATVDETDEYDHTAVRAVEERFE
jgi:hypothetical protein